MVSGLSCWVSSQTQSIDRPIFGTSVQPNLGVFKDHLIVDYAFKVNVINIFF